MAVIPEWRRRELLERAADREAAAAERLGQIFDLPEPDALPATHTFDGPHPHRCKRCGRVWTHEARVCATPAYITPACPTCAEGTL